MKARKRKKAISPLLASIILIAIVVVGGLILFSLWSSMAGTTSKKTQVNFDYLALYRSVSDPKAIFAATLKNAGNKPIIQLIIKLHNETAYTVPSVNASNPLRPGEAVGVLLTPPTIHDEWYIVGNFYSVTIVRAEATDGSSFSHTLTVMCLGQMGPSVSPPPVGSAVVFTETGVPETPWLLGWNSPGWSYRKSHVINSSPGAGTNYPIRIVVYYGDGTDDGENVYLNSGCREDFGDVRFTGGDGVTLLDYTMGTKVDGWRVVFWVKVPEDLSTTAQTMYLYYGNPDATTTANETAAGVTFDNFNDGVLDSALWNTHCNYSLWNPLGGAASVSEYSAEMVHCGYAGYIRWLGDNSWMSGECYAGMNHYSVRTFSKNETIIMEFRVSWSNINWGGTLAYLINSHGVYLFDPNNASWASDEVSRDIPNEAAYIDFSNSSILNNDGTVLRIIVWGDGTYDLIFVSGNQYISNVYHGTIQGWENLSDEYAVCFHSDVDIVWGYVAHNTYWDNTVIRRYVEPEPSHGEGGKEESTLPILNVDGVNYVAAELPLTFNWTTGSSHTFSWTSLLPHYEDERLAWRSTTGLSRAVSGTIVVPPGRNYVNATFNPQYRLLIYIFGNGTTNPPIGEYWHDAGTTVDLQATPKPGNLFDSWKLGNRLKEIANPPEPEMNETVIMAEPTGETEPISFNTPEIPVTMTQGYIAQARFFPPEKHLVVFKQTGLDGTAVGTVVTVNGVSFSKPDLPHFMLVDDGATITYSYSTAVSSLTGGKRFSLTGIVGRSSPVTVTSNITITGNYECKLQVAFLQSGLDSTADGTVVTVNGVDREYADLPYLMWVNPNTTIYYSYSPLLQRPIPNGRFSLTEVSGQVSPIVVTSPVTVTGNYVAQWLITFTEQGLWNTIGHLPITNSSELITNSTVLKVGTSWYGQGGTSVQYWQMPYSCWADEGATVHYVYLSPFGTWNQLEKMYWQGIGGTGGWVDVGLVNFDCSLLEEQGAISVTLPQVINHIYLVQMHTSRSFPLWSRGEIRGPPWWVYHPYYGLEVKLELSEPYYPVSYNAAPMLTVVPDADPNYPFATVSFWHFLGNASILDNTYEIPETSYYSWGANTVSPRTSEFNTTVIWSIYKVGGWFAWYAGDWYYQIGSGDYEGIRFFGIPWYADGYDQLYEYKLTVAAPTGGTTDPAPGTYWYSNSSLVDVTATPNSGYVLDRWILDGSDICASNKITVNMNSDHTLRAEFVPVGTVSTSTLTLAATGGTTTPPAGSYTVKTGSLFTATATPDSGFVFDRWILDGVDIGSANSITVTVTEDCTLQAVFLYMYPLSISTSYGGTTNPLPGTYTYKEGTQVKVAAIPSFDYPFMYWELDGVNVGSENPIQVLVNQSHVLKAVFWDVFSLQITSTYGGTTEPSPGTYLLPRDKRVTVGAIPLPGYGLKSWTVDGVAVDPSRTVTVTMDQGHTISAVFSLLHKLSINTTAGGTTDPAPGIHSYFDGEQVTVTATPELGWVFDHWLLDGSPVLSNPISVTMSQDHTLQAVFLRLFTLSISQTSYGTTDPAPGTYTYKEGTQVTVIVFPQEGYVFDHWILNGVDAGVDNRILITMDNNYQLQAVILPKDDTQTFSLAITATAGGTTTPPPGVYLVKAGYNFTVKANPDLESTLEQWALDGVNMGVAETITVTMTQNHTLTAHFGVGGITEGDYSSWGPSWESTEVGVGASPGYVEQVIIDEGQGTMFMQWSSNTFTVYSLTNGSVLASGPSDYYDWIEGPYCSAGGKYYLTINYDSWFVEVRSGSLLLQTVPMADWSNIAISPGGRYVVLITSWPSIKVDLFEGVATGLSPSSVTEGNYSSWSQSWESTDVGTGASPSYVKQVILDEGQGTMCVLWNSRTFTVYSLANGSVLASGPAYANDWIVGPYQSVGGKYYLTINYDSWFVEVRRGSLLLQTVPMADWSNIAISPGGRYVVLIKGSWSSVRVDVFEGVATGQAPSSVVEGDYSHWEQRWESTEVGAGASSSYIDQVIIDEGQGTMFVQWDSNTFTVYSLINGSVLASGSSGAYDWVVGPYRSAGGKYYLTLTLDDYIDVRSGAQLLQTIPINDWYAIAISPSGRYIVSITRWPFLIDLFDACFTPFTPPGVIVTETIDPSPLNEEETLIESPHPYPNYYDYTWNVTVSGAENIRVHFVYIDTEKSYDFIYVRYNNGTEIAKYDGYRLDVWSPWVNGDTLLIQLTSDGSVVKSGFVVDKLQWSPNSPLPPFVESPHPYSNSYDYTWTVTRPGAQYIRVRLNIQTERSYDLVYIMDANDTVIKVYSGTYVDIWSPWVAGDTLKIRLTSDGSGVYDGLAVTAVQWSTPEL